MKFKLVLKDPSLMDSLCYFIENPNDAEKAKRLVREFTQFDEYLTVEFDTDTRTAELLRLVK